MNSVGVIALHLHLEETTSGAVLGLELHADAGACALYDATITITPQFNFANNLSPKFVGGDSPQVATRRSEQVTLALFVITTGNFMAANSVLRGAERRCDLDQQKGHKM